MNEDVRKKALAYVEHVDATGEILSAIQIGWLTDQLLTALDREETAVQRTREACKKAGLAVMANRDFWYIDDGEGDAFDTVAFEEAIDEAQP